MQRQTKIHGSTIIAMALIVLFALPVFAESPNDIFIIVNKSLPISSASMDEIRDLFLKKKERWGTVEKVVVINAKEGTKLRDSFRSLVLKMDGSEETRYWQDRKIKSGVTPPPDFANTLKAVFMLKSGISYVFREDYKEGVSKVVLIIPAQ